MRLDVYENEETLKESCMDACREAVLIWVKHILLATNLHSTCLT